jgi:hypothetical protein
MTECTTDGVTFSRHGRRVVQALHDGGTITSDAGGLLVREADRTLGLTERLAAALADQRQPSMIVHDQVTMLRQRIFALALGYEDLNDHTALRHDPVLEVMAGAALASAPTLCRLENRADRASMWRMAEALVDAFIESHAAPPEELVLDFDATDVPLHGMQEGRFFHGYYDAYCYLPLYVFCGERLLCAYLRRSNIDPARHAWAILKLLVEKLRAAWPGVRITVRADSGFCRWRMLRWCEGRDLSYLIGVARNSRLLDMAAPLAEQARSAFEGTAQRVFGDLAYAAYTWDRPRRVIVKAEHLPPVRAGEGKSNLRFVVTNLAGEAQELYERVYCARGDMENRIKEQQLGLFGDRTSCHAFAANQFRLLLSAAAFVLVEHVRRVGLRGTDLARAQATRLRLELFKIGARVTISARRIVLHLAKGFPHRALFALAAQRLMAPS